ncbi:MAG: polysaccharide deacetylase family protein [Nitrospira sp.]|nr:polysaccharide deacetylase family protein [Nitrospira sp.]
MHKKRPLKRFVLQVIKTIGGFVLCHKHTAKALRILCYHGISLDDEHKFREMLFMTPDLFRKRMEWLKARGFKVLGLGEAVSSLYAGDLPENAIVITFDDGWYGVYKHALPILSSLGFTATVYANSYYMEKETFVYNLFVPYLFWRTKAKVLDLDQLGHGLKGHYCLESMEQRDAVVRQLIQFGDEQLCALERQSFALDLAKYLIEDGESMERNRVMTLMARQEIADSVCRGFDVQLHTHTHRLSLEDEAVVQREIQLNRDALGPLVKKELTHFCYPSGIYSQDLFPWLERMGIHTATTTKPGLNYPDSHPLELSRFLDNEDISELEFHAEVYGVLELFRKGRFLFSRLGVSE